MLHNVASDQSLRSLLTGFAIKIKTKVTNRPDTSTMTNGQVQHITEEESTSIQWVKLFFPDLGNPASLSSQEFLKMLVSLSQKQTELPYLFGYKIFFHFLIKNFYQSYLDLGILKVNKT